MAALKPQAAKGGYAPDCYVTSDQVPNARPSPAMIFKNMIELDVWAPQSVIKVCPKLFFRKETSYFILINTSNSCSKQG